MTVALIKKISILVVLIAFIKMNVITSASEKNILIKNNLKTPLDIITFSLTHLDENETVFGIYNELTVYFAQNNQLESFQRLLEHLPERFQIKKKMLYEVFYITYLEKYGVSKLKQSLISIENVALRDAIIEKVFLYALQNKPAQKYNILLSLVQNESIKNRIDILIINNLIDYKNYQLIEEKIISIQNYKHKDIIYSKIAVEYANAADNDRVNIYINKIDDINIKNETIVKVIKQFLKKSMYKISYEYLNLIINTDYYDPAIICFIEQLAIENKIQSAYQLYDSLENTEFENLASSKLAIGFASNINIELMYQFLNLIDTDDLKNDTLHKCAIILAHLQLQEESLNLVKQISEVKLQEKVLKELISIYVKNSNVNFTLVLLQQISMNNLSQFAIESFIYGLVEKQRYAEALTSLEYIIDKQQKDSIIYNVLLTQLDQHNVMFLDSFLVLLKSELYKADFFYHYTNYIINQKEIKQIKESIVINTTLLKKSKLSNNEKLTYSLNLSKLYFAIKDTDKAYSDAKILTKKLLKESKSSNESIKIDCIKLLIEMNDIKRAIQLIESIDNIRVKVLLILLFDEMDISEEKTINLFEDLTKKIIK